MMSRLWGFFLHRSPDKWALFADDAEVGTNLTLEATEERMKCCPYTLPMISLWPIWLVWVLLGFFVISCFVFCCSPNIVRRFPLVSRGPAGKRHMGEENGEREPLIARSNLQ